MSNFSVIVPSPIKGTMLTSSTVPAHATTGPDPDPALWVAGTAYLVNDRVTYLATNSIYVRVVAGTTAGTPAVLASISSQLTRRRLEVANRRTSAGLLSAGTGRR